MHGETTDQNRNIDDPAAADGAVLQSGPAEVETESVEIRNMSAVEMQKKLEEALASIEEKQKALEEKEKEAARMKELEDALLATV